MLFRKYNGELVEININDFLTDTDYYKEIMGIKYE
uniref:Uncharacterized protein n=1 Tax=viral metagenome TaxID=1070528 RepID=A0A6C0AYC1_9ZZZZ|tara:strand:- start:34 stop:138 length:105 start_codon:yes stop_codon:yes gene_type:complete